MKSENPRYLCDVCQQLLDLREELREHYRQVHYLHEPPGSWIPPHRGSRPDGAWRYSYLRDDGRLREN